MCIACNGAIIVNDSMEWTRKYSIKRASENYLLWGEYLFSTILTCHYHVLKTISTSVFQLFNRTVMFMNKRSYGMEAIMGRDQA